jgi:hypothetical protein
MKAKYVQLFGFFCIGIVSIRLILQIFGYPTSNSGAEACWGLLFIGIIMAVAGTIGIHSDENW